MKIMLIIATAMAVVPIGLALLMPDWYLGDKQNAVDQTDLKGDQEVIVEVNDRETKQ